jgi:hypothetical protein
MNPLRFVRSCSIIGGLGLAVALTTTAPSARANVFASNVKINGGTSNVSVAPGASVSISYILNEPASAGVTIKILSGTTAVRTISLTGGSAGTLRGTSIVVWDGKNGSNTNVPEANYSVSIKAASSGYAGWTKITDDDNEGNYVYEARGIAVDRNTNSPYYGRVFVGNSFDNSGQGTSANYGDYLGIQKLNADGSYADEGGFSDGGISWGGNGYAPWKIRVSDDDYVYVEDWLAKGDIYRFDGAVSSASKFHAFAAPPNGSRGSIGGFGVVGKGTNTVLWTVDNNYPTPSLGIRKFAMQPDGTFAAINGTQVVALGGSPGLSSYPWAVALDKTGTIYTLQGPSTQGDPSARVFRFPAYDPATNAGAPELTASWVAGPGDDYCGGRGIAVDPTGNYVAACFWGYHDSSWTSGNLKILKAADGTVVTNLDLGVAYPNSRTADPTHHMATDADWDAAGNLYYLDDGAFCWRAFSPPGANAATTVALPVVQVAQPPYITSIGVSGGTVTIHFTGGSNDVASAFVLLSAPTAQGTYSPAAGSIITGSGGSFQATVPANGPALFYRVLRLGTVPMLIKSLKVAGGTVTINFTGPTGNPPPAYNLFSSRTANGIYTIDDRAGIIELSPGLFQATVPTNGPVQFYRIGR